MTVSSKPRRSPAESPCATSSPAVIRRGELYRLSHALRILKWGAKALRLAKRKGLAPIEFAKAKWLTGDQILDFFEQQRAEQAQRSAAGGEHGI